MHSKKYLVNAAARARAARHGADREPNDEKLSGPTIDNGPDVTDWDGTVNCRDSEFVSSWDEADSDDGLELVDLEGKELLQSLELRAQKAEAEKVLAKEVRWFGLSEIVEQASQMSQKEWIKAEGKLGVKNGNSARTERRHNQKAREKEARDVKLRKTHSACLMRDWFQPRVPNPALVDVAPASISLPTEEQNEIDRQDFLTDKVFQGYFSDEEESCDDRDDELWDNITDSDYTDNQASYRVTTAPLLKRCRLEIPARVQRSAAREELRKSRNTALKDIERLVRSKRDVFAAGSTGLQSYRARAIESHLRLVVNEGRQWREASGIASQAQGFSKSWGSRQVRKWTTAWMKERILPESNRGHHVKSFSLLSDPTIAAEMRSFMRTNKWCMNPAKLAEYSRTTMLDAELKKYTTHMNTVEMPRGLKQYLEAELFPRVQLKVNKGISTRQAQRWLRAEGFEFTVHAKGLYYDGHERPDVIHDRQKRFIPEMAEHARRLIHYAVDDVNKEILPNLLPVEHILVLVAHDEMTAQAHDGRKASWILSGEQPLRKKGVGRGLHQSDVICSTFGWLPEASQTLEYGKNYEGYWNGELFVKQLKEKIIPAFEKIHGPGYQALIMVDNSQGHSAYGLDALLVSRMNLNPGGKQAVMRNGWFMKDGLKVTQKMIFPDNHPDENLRGLPKGMRHVLMERGLWCSGLLMQCGKGKKDTAKCNPNATACCASRILERQPDFKEQCSLVMEVIAAAGHLCIFLPKYHCELNFIEFFWGAVKRYLRDNCDYTFVTLQENMPKALASVGMDTIRKWEHHHIRWLEAYRNGLDAKSAQFQVQAFSSRKYKSHRRVPERVAAALDQY